MIASPTNSTKPTSVLFSAVTTKNYNYYKPEKIKVQKLNIESQMNNNDYIMDYKKNFEAPDEDNGGDQPVNSS